MTDAILGGDCILSIEASAGWYAPVAQITNIGAISQKRGTIDITNFDSPAGSKEFLAGSSEGDSVPVEAIYLPTDTTQAYISTAYKNAEVESVRIVFGTDATATFDCIIDSYSVNPGGREDKVMFNASFKISGQVSGL